MGACCVSYRPACLPRLRARPQQSPRLDEGFLGSLWPDRLQRLTLTCLPAVAEGEAPAEPPAEAAGEEEGQAQEDAVKPTPPKLDYSKKQLEYVVASPGQVCKPRCCGLACRADPDCAAGISIDFNSQEVGSATIAELKEMMANKQGSRDEILTYTDILMLPSSQACCVLKASDA